ncbi:MAG: NADH-quinone oxidoreductase subunit L [Bacteroidia bacterium]
MGLYALILWPLLGFAINGLLGSKLPKTVVGMIGTAAVLIPFVSAVSMWGAVQEGALVSRAFTFLQVGDLHIEFKLLLDRLSLVMALVITGIGTLIHLYSMAYMAEDAGFYKFFAYLNLFVFNMLILVLGANFMMLFFGWEGVGLCSYLLIGFWYHNPEFGYAARKAFVMNRIGDLGLLLGLFLVIQHFGSLDYQVVFSEVAKVSHPQWVYTSIAVLLFIGAMGKSAQIPLYTWLPDAMAGPTPVSALIHAATMVTAGVYLVVRSEALYALAPVARDLILYIGLATSLMAAFIGLKQNDIKKVLAYSTVSQLGLMFIALGCGAYSAAMFHLVTHAFFKALLFLGSGSVIHGMHHEQDIRRMGGLRKAMPLTYWTFLIGTLAISGFPFLSGFFSKDEILLHTFQHSPVVYALAVFSAGLTGIYMFRMFFLTFHGTYRNSHYPFEKVHESPALMTIPLAILAVLSVLGGLLNLPHYLTHNMAEGLAHWLAPLFVFGDASVHVEASTEWALLGVAVSVFAIAFFWMRHKYISQGAVAEEDADMPASGSVLAHKFYVDELYDSLFARPLQRLGEWMYRVLDRKGFVQGTDALGAITLWKARVAARLQSGNIELYLIIMVLAAALMLGLEMFA